MYSGHSCSFPVVLLSLGEYWNHLESLKKLVMLGFHSHKFLFNNLGEVPAVVLFKKIGLQLLYSAVQ